MEHTHKLRQKTSHSQNQNTESYVFEPAAKLHSQILKNHLPLEIEGGEGPSKKRGRSRELRCYATREFKFSREQLTHLRVVAPT